jgi:hypothetical protein
MRLLVISAMWDMVERTELFSHAGFLLGEILTRCSTSSCGLV